MNIKNLFTKHDWSKWKSLGTHQKISSNTLFELFVRECSLTGLKEYKDILVTTGVYTNNDIQNKIK